jgi:uncharacterized surface protein with fasciclin (FAS1) repeats
MNLTTIIAGATFVAAAATAGAWGSCNYDGKTASSDCASECSGEAAAVNIVRVDHHEMKDSNTIVDIAAGNENFSTLVAAVKAAGLVDALSGDGPFTVFAPTNDAFAKLPAGTVEALLKPENRDQLKSILTFHVVKGDVRAADVVKVREATTLQGQRVDVSVRRDSAGNVAGVEVNGANVVSTDIVASNGVIHVIDEVILPETKNAVEVAQAAGNFSTLIAAAKAAGLADTLMNDGPYTILAPTNDAFAKLPGGTVEALLRPENRDTLATILKYHVIKGRVYDDQVVKLDEAKTLAGEKVRIGIVDGRLTINDSAVIKSDIEASNAVIHVVDTVLIPE